MERDLKFILLISAALLAVGCGEDQPAPGTGALNPLAAMPRYAVVSSDFSSSSIAMLDEEFDVIDESWLNSGTTYPGLVATLSGDAVLPTRQAGDGTFAVIDRLLTDVASQFFLPNGNLNGQVRTHGDIGDSGFSSNPQDLIFVDANSAWAPRYESNLNPEAPSENQGNDLFEIDPTDMIATGARIDLSSLNTTALVDAAPAPVEVEVLARPSRGVLIGSSLIVGLDRISASFDAAGPGMIAVVDPVDGSVAGVVLEGFASCGRVVPVPGAPTKVAVGCVGFSNPFNDEAQLRASSGIVLLEVGETNVSVERIWRVADDAESPRAVNALVALDAERVLAVASGNFDDTTDTLYEIDLVSGALDPVHVSSGSFTIGVSAYDPESEMLYVPDAASNVVIEMQEDGDRFTEVGSTEIAPGLSLPPTQVYLLNQ